ncbi:PWWP domain-containing DNA repair factor 3A [Colossoma macropomum]|uniref:PWWP domain-containing DNA repair factor 3A n=1 Tax=Colossoma macropomum TaxID=42526 RepID=UPI001864B6F3|nr:PWWP domain-containing DNA repair factor 3A [Colossoma macropomum]XP_036452885.1 PWWP domain-containing DNA repair factor 3A [Colossoma macropomum]
MSSSEDCHSLRHRKNPERTCRVIAEVRPELKRPASKRTGSTTDNSKEAPAPPDPGPASADGPLPKKKTRGKVKKFVLQQTGAEPAVPSHSATHTAVNGRLSPSSNGVGPAVPQQTTACLQKMTRPQRGRRRKGEPPPEQGDGSNVGANGPSLERLDSGPAARSAETEETPRRKARVRRGRSTERTAELRSPTETSAAVHSHATLCSSPQQDASPLPSDLSPGPSTPKPRRGRPGPMLSSTPLGTACLSRKPPDTGETTSPQSHTANGHRKEPKPSPVKRSPSDVPARKTTRSRKPRAPDKSITQQKEKRKKKEQEVCDGPPVKRQRKKGGTKAKPQDQPAHRVRPRFELHDSELQEPELQEPELQETEQNLSSDLSIELSLMEEPEMINHSLSLQEDEEEDEEELPSFLEQTNNQPSSIREGLCVWCKLRKYPFWPAIVKSVNHKNKKASIVFIDGCLFNKKTIRKGLTVSLRTLKPFDCKEYDQFVDIAKEKYGASFTWCLELISDYRIRIGCGSFAGSFIEYLADDISCPVRMRYPEGSSELAFPSQQLLSEEQDGEGERAEEPDEEQSRQPDEGHSKKLLPDRALAARNRANERLVDFIVKKRGAENRLKAVISGQEPSKWLQALQSCSRSVGGLYLEDDRQVDKVYSYLNKLCEAAVKTSTGVENTDRIRFILDVLLPEAIIYAIAGVDRLSLDKAEEKYRRGPQHSNREREEFDMMIEQQMRVKAIAAKPSP